MPMLFANIAWMDYYRGITDTDKPSPNDKKNTDNYVTESGDAYEKYNFLPHYNSKYGDGLICSGHIEMGDRTINLDHIVGCEDSGRADKVDEVTVVFVAKHKTYDMHNVVGWYKNATVYRNYQTDSFNGITCTAQNVFAKKEDCVLLPTSERSSATKWKIPTAGRNGAGNGIGRAGIWYATEAEDVRKDIMEKIDNYTGENWVDKQ